jgi:hypothetical protein
MPTTSGLERREFLQLLAAAGVAGGVQWPAIAPASAATKLPAGTLIIGIGGTGCKAVRRAISFGFDPDGFSAIDVDGDDLAASGAAHQVQCGTKSPDGSWIIGLDERADANARVNALLHEASKVVLVAGLGGRVGGHWAFGIAASDGLAARHIAERGMNVELVTTLPREDEPLHRQYAAEQLLSLIRDHRAVTTRVAFQDGWRFRFAPRPSLGSLLERELWLTCWALLCALGEGVAEDGQSLTT